MPTNSSQSANQHKHICKEQSKDAFYNDSPFQFITSLFECFLVCQGGGFNSLKVTDKTLFPYVR